MRPHELDAAVSVWREANIARGAPHGPERTARICTKLSARNIKTKGEAQEPQLRNENPGSQ
jgi:hypothetical protein